jgi:outer membrane protein insertion porin family
VKIKPLLIFVLFCLLLPASAEDAYQGLVSEIRISGNRLVSDAEIIEQLRTFPGQAFQKDSVIEDLRRIYSMGYFVAKSVEAKPYQKPDGSIILEYTVEENAPVTDLVVYGNNLVSELDAFAHFDDLVGKPENAKLLSEKIQLLEREYYMKGYIVARVKDIDIDESGLLKIYIDEGNINEIKYTGNDKTQVNYLKHLVSNTHVDEPYNESKFGKDYKKLQGTGYFQNVTRAVKPNDEGNGYVLEIQLNEKEKTTSLGLGGGINSSAGLFGNANFSKGNIHGKGESLNINALLGSGYGAGSTLNANSNLVRRGRYTSISASYNTPFFRDSDYSLKEYINYSRGPNFTVDLSQQSLLSGGASVSRNIDDNQSISYGTSLNLIDIEDRDRKTYINEVADNILKVDHITNKDLFNANQDGFLGGKRELAKAEARALRDEQIISGSFVDFTTNYTYQDLDDTSRPRDGIKFRAGLTPTLGLGDVTSFTKLHGSASRFVPMPRRSTLIFNVRGDYGLLGTIPQFSKFRLGSTTGVRGYRQFTDLGVGDKLLISTTELRTPIYNVIPPLQKFKLLKNVDFALFADAGVVGGDSRLNLITNRLSRAAAVGFGIRVNVPLVGALRFDVGFPLIQALTDKTKMYRFNFGPANFY